MNMNMKKTAKAMMITSLVLALPTIPMANTATDRALFEMNSRGSGQSADPLIRAGHAPVDDAVAKIVPAPYRILMDESVPASMQLVWGGGDNWMEVLRRALAPVGLVAETDWAKNTIKISWKAKPSQVIAQSSQETGIAAAPAAPSAFEVIANEAPRNSYQARAQSAPVSPASTVARQTYPAQPAQTGGFVVAQQSRNVGGFVVTKPEPVAAQAAAQAPRVSRASSAPQVAKSDPVERYAMSANADLPSSAVMWRLMKAAVNGEKIVLSGVSSLSSEEQRARYGEMYASKLRTRLIEIGFPADTVVLGDRQSDRANKAGVRIMVSKEEA